MIDGNRLRGRGGLGNAAPLEDFLNDGAAVAARTAYPHARYLLVDASRADMKKFGDFLGGVYGLREAGVRTPRRGFGGGLLPLVNRVVRDVRLRSVTVPTKRYEGRTAPSAVSGLIALTL